MTIKEAFQIFYTALQNNNLSAPIDESDPEIFGSRVTTVTANNASLRLVWNGKDYGLRLEITHGPLSGPQTWLDLFESYGSADKVSTIDKTGSLESAISYGIELIGKSHAV